MRDAEVEEDQAPAASLVSQVVPKLHVAAPLACACRDSMLCAHDVSGRAEQRPEHTHHPVEDCVLCVFITAGPITKLFAGGEESGGHVL